MNFRRSTSGERRNGENRRVLNLRDNRTLATTVEEGWPQNPFW